MPNGSNASPEVFGFDFQVNATIFLLLDNIKDVKTIRMEGASEDIELTMNDGNQIMAQAKGVVKGSSDFSHVRSKLSDAIRTLSSADNSSVEQLILITNSKNPLKEDTSNQFRYNSSNKQRQRDYAQRCIISLFNLSAPLLSPTFKEYVPANYFKKFPKAMSIVFPWQAMRRNTPSLWLA